MASIEKYKNSKIKKRDGSLVDFQADKITQAIKNAGVETGEFGEKEAEVLSHQVVSRLDELDELTVENIQDLVESVLLDSKYKATAKAYIIYREFRARERKPNIFKQRINLKPYEYPQLIEFQHAIQHSYWLHTEFNYTSDIQDFKTNISEVERSVIRNAMLAIAQVEVAVKNFWGDLHNRMPKPEIGAVGATFAANEVIHHDAYSHLLEILGLNSDFEKIKEIPALYQRVKYLTDSTKLTKSESNKDFTLSLILFSLFIEHVSLFSQFLIIMSFNKYKNIFKGISNVIEATSKEEQIHGMFGIELVKIIREENPEWFDETMKNTIVEACKEAYRSEEIVIDWIYERGDLNFLPKKTVKEFVKNRLNNSLDALGYEKVFEVNEDLIEETEWFSDEIIATKHVDFFVKRSINYTKRSQSFDANDLF